MRVEGKVSQSTSNSGPILVGVLATTSIKVLKPSMEGVSKIPKHLLAYHRFRPRIMRISGKATIDNLHCTKLVAWGEPIPRPLVRKRRAGGASAPGPTVGDR